MKKLCPALLLLLTLVVLSPIYASETEIPSLFAGDEAWYKDAVSPLIIRNGVQFIPAELCSMLDTISVTTPREDNLLIHNTNTGAYISVLFSDRSAAVNGRIVENIAVFRDSGVFYIDAKLVADAVGLTLETYEEASGSISLRLSDETRLFTMEELISTYLPKTETPADSVLPTLPEEEDSSSYNGKLKRIYVLCKSSESSYTPFSAQANCELYDIRYTWFLDSRNTTEDFLSVCADGEYGVVPSPNETYSSTAEALDTLNETISVYTHRQTHFTLSTGEEAEDARLIEAGYIPLQPDFVVNGSSYPDSLLADIINYIGTAGSCTLLLEDCWNSERMVILLSELANSLYCTSNLSDYSFEQ